MNPVHALLWVENLSLDQVATLSGLHRTRLARLSTGRYQATAAERAALSQAFPGEIDWGDNPYADLPALDQVRQRLCDLLQSAEGELIVRRIAQLLAT